MAKYTKDYFEQEKTKSINRLHRIEGQIKGVEKMIREDRSCQSIIQQLMAVREALAQLGLKILKQEICHIDIKQKEKMIEKYAKDVFRLK